MYAAPLCKALALLYSDITLRCKKDALNSRSAHLIRTLAVMFEKSYSVNKKINKYRNLNKHLSYAHHCVLSTTVISYEYEIVLI